MNIVDMVVNRLSDQLPEMMAKVAANLPPEITGTIGQIGERVASFQAQLDRIEAQNSEILALLTEEKNDGRNHRHRDLSGA